MYAKIFSQIYDGTLCTKGPWEALVTFQQFLVLADPEGNVDMTAEAIARRTTIPIDIIKTGIQSLTLPDPQSRTPTEEGRRIIPLAEGRDWGWKVVNYSYYRDLKREEDRREYHRQYWHKRKEKLSTQQNSTTQPQTQPVNLDNRQETVDSRKDTKTKGKNKATGSAFAPPDWIPLTAWQGFEQMRNRIKKPMTDRARELIVSELEKLRLQGFDPQAVIEQSERNGWQDVFPLKDKGGKQEKTLTQLMDEREAKRATR